jgi:TetR/AcrR family transcriptional regulator
MTTGLSRRELRRQQHHELNRNQLLDAAEEVFGAKGFHATTLKEVADLAEFSVGSVYSFFPSKDDLFLQIFLRRGAELLPRMEAIVESDAPPLDQLHQLVDLEVGFFREHRHFARLYLRSAPSTALPPTPVYEGFKANFARAMELQARVFRRGQERGELRTGDPYVLARMLSGIVATFQLLDPATGSDDARPGGGMALEELHEIVAGAFER